MDSSLKFGGTYLDDIPIPGSQRDMEILSLVSDRLWEDGDEANECDEDSEDVGVGAFENDLEEGTVNPFKNSPSTKEVINFKQSTSLSSGTLEIVE